MKLYGIITLSCIGAAFVLILALHFLRRKEYHPFHRFLSEYAVGRGGSLMRAVFFIAGAGTIAFSRSVENAAMWQGGDPSMPILACAFGAGLILMGALNGDLSTPESPRTPVGRIHASISILAFAAILLDMASVWFMTPVSGIWRTSQQFSFYCFVVAACLFIAQILLWTQMKRWMGLAQRALVIVVFVWMVKIALVLMTLSAGTT
jgi:hypothetical protein